MSRTGFTERTFEFCYNAEFCNKFNGLLVTSPSLPSQRQEKYLGYDVKFELEHGNFRRSIFLQHKVSNFIKRRQHNNKHFYDQYNSPYFRFPVDKDQHNKMVEKGNIFYCAPLFFTQRDLHKKFKNNSILDSSIWIDPYDTRILDDKNHNITYGKDGRTAHLHSKPLELKIISEESYNSTESEIVIDSNYIKDLLSKLIEYNHDSLNESNYPYLFEENIGDLKKVQFILGSIYKVSWIVLP